ncbi:hypothetical protein [Burkholderia cenocepacia]|uniref:hypothetical protein n=1 Tax=Burkholderia cenocepacia TaxID=95486 RepID=UPI0006AC7134|nr:hypothetical protein [Burkholderia cenocepacia]KOR18385.1 hypothetical protein ABW54_27195 [Burkholderia cenocepacia]MBR7981126.1 hypothetical protein [Burkholderia cenocepacia]
MTDIRALKTLPEALPDVSVMTSMLSVTGGLPLLDALESASNHLAVALDVLSETAANSTEYSNQLYAVLTSAGIAIALVNSVIAAIEVGNKETRHD